MRRFALVASFWLGACLVAKAPCPDGTVCADSQQCGPVAGCVSAIRTDVCDKRDDGVVCTLDLGAGTCHVGLCVVGLCGDGVVDLAYGESCDAGSQNSNEAGAACRSNCQLARCGDGVIDPGEVCDDGNLVNGDGCAAHCRSLEVCGNGVVDTVRGELCDDGNQIQTDACHNDCRVPRCGDGLIDPGYQEECDAGDANSDAPNAACRNNCRPRRCGDGILDVGEACDDGNNSEGDGCSGTCV